MGHEWGRCPACGRAKVFCLIHLVCVHYLCVERKLKEQAEAQLRERERELAEAKHEQAQLASEVDRRDALLQEDEETIRLLRESIALAEQTIRTVRSQIDELHREFAKPKEDKA